jgi:hypothetical protein
MMASMMPLPRDYPSRKVHHAMLSKPVKEKRAKLARF